MVVVPTTAPEVAVIVKPLPATVGVKVGNVINTPAEKLPEVPETSAVPPKVTAPVNSSGPLLHTLPLASFAVMLTKLPLTGMPAVAELIVAGFITNWIIAPGLTSKVAVPVWLGDPPATVNVLPPPAVMGVTLTPVNWPPVNAAEVPVIPAVPVYVTVEPKLVTVWLFASCAVSVTDVIGVPAVCGEVSVEIAK
jgi:hypothetical protein